MGQKISLLYSIKQLYSPKTGTEDPDIRCRSQARFFMSGAIPTRFLYGTKDWNYFSKLNFTVVYI